MIKRIVAVTLLSMALTACESSSTENGNSNASPRPSATTQATPAAPPESSPSAPAQFKAGDKVKLNSNGTTATATVVSIDEKGGKATVRIDGEKQDKIVALADITKQ